MISLQIKRFIVFFLFIFLTTSNIMMPKISYVLLFSHSQHISVGEWEKDWGNVLPNGAMYCVRVLKKKAERFSFQRCMNSFNQNTFLFIEICFIQVTFVVLSCGWSGWKKNCSVFNNTYGFVAMNSVFELDSFKHMSSLLCMCLCVSERILVGDIYLAKLPILLILTYSQFWPFKSNRRKQEATTTTTIRMFDVYQLVCAT